VIRWSVVIVLLSCRVLCAQQTITIVNTMPEPVQLWIYYKDKSHSGPFPISKKQSYALLLDKPGQYYIIIRDQLKRDLIVGWVDLHAMAETRPVVALLALYQSRGDFLGYDNLGMPIWRKRDATPYAWRVTLTPFTGNPVPLEHEIVFVNNPAITVIRTFPLGYPDDFK
jgi:hypothetical protein